MIAETSGIATSSVMVLLTSTVSSVALNYGIMPADVSKSDFSFCYEISSLSAVVLDQTFSLSSGNPEVH